MQSTAALLRKRTPWRELLHALPAKHRIAQWLRRDAIEMNEAVLRRPYYTLKKEADFSQMRDTLITPAVVGPSLNIVSPHSGGAPLPRYPSGWETVAPQSPHKE